MKASLKFICLLFLLVSCGKTNESSNVNSPLKIGAILPMTGSLATMGENEKNALLIAKNDLQEQGIMVDLLFSDSKSSATEGVIEARKLIDMEKVDLLITATSGLSNAVKPLAEQSKLNLIVFTMDESIAVNSPYVTRLYEGAQDEADAMLNFAKKRQPYTRTALLYSKAPTNEHWAENIMLPTLTNYGYDIPLVESFNIGENDFKTIALKLKMKKIETLILNDYGFSFPSLFNELEKLGIKKKLEIIGGWGFINAELSNESLEGVLIAGPKYFFEREKAAQKFIEKYEKQYGETPNFDSALAYNALMLIGKKMNKSNYKEPSSKIFETHEIHNGVIGDFSIDKDGNMKINTTVGRFLRGRITIENNN